MPPSTAPTAGLTPARVIDAAVALTRRSHLAAWSIRDLARELGVVPSVIYHHIGGKDLLARAVVERATSELAPPPADLDWQDWARALLLPLRDLLVPYPGVAAWMLMHGPTFDRLIPIIDAGVAALRRGGFGDRAAFAYAVLLNVPVQSIAHSDERLRHEEDGPRDHATMMADFQRTSADSPGVHALAESLMRPFIGQDHRTAPAGDDHYAFVVETTIRGLAAQLDDC